MRPIDGDALLDKVLRHYTEQEKKGNLSFVACEIKQSFADMVNEAPTITADDYFDAVDRIKPCPNCRYTLLGALTEDEPRWIPVTERLPEPFVSVLVQMPGEKPFPTVREGYISTDGKWVGGYFKRKTDEVTHWMPLPEPPKEENHD